MTIVIGEIGCNHNGDIEKAVELIAAAKSCGCDMVKFQAYEPYDMPDQENIELYKKYSVPISWYRDLFDEAQRLGIPLFASVFAPWAVNELEQYNPAAYKIASPESTRLPDHTYRSLVRMIRTTGKTFIASSGTKDSQLVTSFSPDVFLHCVAGYPATFSEVDLELAASVEGLSDHSQGITIALAMVALGAKYIEKHFKVDDDCVDSAFSINPVQMRFLCKYAHK